MTLTLAYLTARKDCSFRWFAESLRNEIAANGGLQPSVLVVDLWSEAHKPEDGWTTEDAARRRDEFHLAATECGLADFRHSRPVWDTWQGPHRLTRDNWFAKANYLNAAVALCQTEYLACVDDLSVLMPGFLRAAEEATTFNGVTCGAYRKVKDLAVEVGRVKSFTDHPTGHDPRWRFGAETPTFCRGSRMYGCSFVVPVNAVIAANGWTMLSGGLGFEDSTFGSVLENNGVRFMYDRRLLTYESEELHFVEKPMRREDYGVSPNDKSHAFLKLCQNTRRFDQFGGDGLAGVRARVLAGEPLPILREPTNEWYTNKPLADL